MSDTKKVTRDELQRECQEVWDVECYANVSRMVEYILGCEDEAAPFSWDDVENMDYFSIQAPGSAYEDTYTEEGRDELIEELEEEFDDLDGNVWEDLSEAEQARHEVLENAIYDINNQEPETWEVNSWYMVTGWMANQLSQRGEPVLNNSIYSIWGRVGAGQSCYMDSVIVEIVKEARNLVVTD